jgi:glycerol uptake facilitator protein
VPGDVGARLAGASLAAATLWITWRGYYRRFYGANGVVIGEPGAEITAMTRWTFLPTPSSAGVVVGDAPDLPTRRYLTGGTPPDPGRTHASTPGEE